MATASSNPTSPALNAAAGGVSSPKSRRWTQIVGESELVVPVVIPPQCQPSPSSTSVAQEHMESVSGWATGNSPLQDTATEAQPESFENSDSDNNAVKKPAWNKPNGSTEAGPVMGAVSWPALSESTKASPKSVSYDPLKTPLDGSVPPPQGTGIAPSSSPKPVHTNNSTTPNSTPNHVPARQRSSKRAGGGNSSNTALANGSVSQPQQLQSMVVEMAPNSAGKPGVEPYSRDNVHRDGGQRGGFGSQSIGGNENQYTRSSPRKGNGRPRPRGDGSYHHGHGGGRDQERGNQEWNANRSFGNRDAHLQPLRVPSRPFLQVPPMYYVPGPHPDSLVMPMLASPPPGPPVFYQFLDPQLLSKIVNQIEYYFSNENLIKDMYLRKEMDDQGWVHVRLIASFKKVAELTDDIQLIMHAIRTSTVVEIQGEKLRPRNDWKKWILPPSVQYSISSPQSARSPGSDVLSQHFQGVTLDEKNANEHERGNAEAHLNRSSSEVSNSSVNTNWKLEEQRLIVVVFVCSRRIAKFNLDECTQILFEGRR
nr:la-related protein 1C-like [Ipomoea batatas]